MIELVYLVRHGESEWNVRGVTQGQTAHPRLTPRGRGQMAAAAAKIARLTSGHVHVHVTSSDLVRGVEAAEIVAQRLGASRAQDLRLRERSFGLFQATQHARTVFWTSRASLVALTHGGVEEPSRVRSRGEAALRSLARGMTHVIVGHGELFRLLPGGAELGVVDNGDVIAWDGKSVLAL